MCQKQGFGAQPCIKLKADFVIELGQGELVICVHFEILTNFGL